MYLKSRFSRFYLAVFVIAAIFLLGMGTERILTRAERSSTGDSIVPAALADEQVAAMDVPSVVEKDVPAVVRIDVKKVVQVSQQMPSIFNDPFFRQFFGQGFSPQFNVPREDVERFRGSGVIISDDGYILTNNHVVTFQGQAMDEVEVTLPPPDNRKFSAKIVGTDPRTEVAVLKISAKDLPFIKLGTSSELRLGQTVLAIGYPFTVGITVTEGIVSGLAKQIASSQGVYIDFIQTDAAINPGNSGGALINTRGELIGINTLIVSNTGSYAGLGFAIPIDEARSVMDDIIKHGSIVHGYLGIYYAPITPDNAEFFGLKEAKGVVVTQVMKGTPAMKAGVLDNDVIIGISGKEIKDPLDVARIVGSMRPGDKAALDVMRAGKELELTAELARNPQEAPVKEKKPGGKVKPELALLNGVGLEDLNDDYRAQLSLGRDVQGVVVTDVDQNSPAADEGLQTGDVIIQVDLKPVADLDDFNAVVKGIKKDKLLLTVLREPNDQRVLITLKP